MARIEGVKTDLDQDKQREFFERRAEHASPQDSLAATTFSTVSESEQRHAAEIAQALPLLELSRATSVLDVGCGGARWGQTLLTEIDPPVARYVGVDFSPRLIDLAKGRNLPNAHFYVMPAGAMDVEVLKFHSIYSLGIVTALCLYMNDSAVAALLTTIGSLLHQGTLFYWREPVSLTGQRLTLVEEFSDKIGDNYNAVYRTPEEYMALIEDSGLFEVERTDFLGDSAFQRHATTRHRYILARRKWSVALD